MPCPSSHFVTCVCVCVCVWREAAGGGGGGGGAHVCVCVRACPGSYFVTCAYAVPIFTLCNVCLCLAHFHPSYMFLFRAHKHIWYTCSFHSRVFIFSVCAYYNKARPCSCSVRVSITGTPAGPDKDVFIFCACVYYRNASGPRQSSSGPRQGRGIHVRCLCLLQQRQRAWTKPCSCSVPVLAAATPADRNKAVFMFGACAYYRNTSGPRQSRVHVRCVCLLQERQRVQSTRPEHEPRLGQRKARDARRRRRSSAHQHAGRRRKRPPPSRRPPPFPDVPEHAQRPHQPPQPGPPPPQQPAPPPAQPGPPRPTHAPRHGRSHGQQGRGGHDEELEENLRWHLRGHVTYDRYVAPARTVCCGFR